MTKKSSKAKNKAITPNPKKKYVLNVEWIYFGLALFIFVLAFIIRIYAFNTPVLSDEATYSILGEKAFKGERMFVDFYEMKPPLLYYCYGFGTMIFGWSAWGLRMLGFFLVFINSVLIAFIAKKFSSISFAFLIGSISFFLANNIYSYGTETVSEHFVTLFTLLGYWFLISPKFKKLSINLMLAGFLIAGGALIKQTAALFGAGALIFLIIQSLNNSEPYLKKEGLKNILFLGLGAMMMIFLCLLPIMVQGSFEEARYWLIEFPSKYTNMISFDESFIYLKSYFGRILKYQLFSLLLLFLSILLLAFNWRKKYFSLLVILLVATLINVIPGYRFYGQYWIPFLSILPLSLLALKNTLENIKKNQSFLFITPLLIFIAFSGDLFQNSSSYFAENYLLNSERAHSGNFVGALYAMTDNLKPRMLPSDKFAILGTETQAYLALDKFPSQKHIYPKLIGRISDKNKIYQQEAYNEFIEQQNDYVIFSVQGTAWRGIADFDDWLYNTLFFEVINNYEPIWVFNLDERKFYSAENGEKVDLYKKNQLISFKKR